MRTVIVHLDHSSESDVVMALNAICERVDEDQWTVSFNKNPYLYVRIYRELEREFEQDELSELKAQLAHWPPVSVAADVSGRHDARAEVQRFVAALLARWRGVVTDEDQLLRDAVP